MRMVLTGSDQKRIGRGSRFQRGWNANPSGAGVQDWQCLLGLDRGRGLISLSTYEGGTFQSIEVRRGARVRRGWCRASSFAGLRLLMRWSLGLAVLPTQNAGQDLAAEPDDGDDDPDPAAQVFHDFRTSYISKARTGWTPRLQKSLLVAAGGRIGSHRRSQSPQNRATNSRPQIDGSFEKPVKLLKSMPPRRSS